MNSEETTPLDRGVLALLQGRGGVDIPWYRANYPDVPPSDLAAVTHYASRGWRRGYDPGPDFSTLGYLRANPDVEASGMNPLVHFLRFGRDEHRSKGLDIAKIPEALWNSQVWRRLYDAGLFFPRHGEPSPSRERAFGDPECRKLLLAGHEASRTGAPRLLLHLLKYLSRRPDTELFLFLEKGGPLLEEYREFAHVAVNQGGIFSAGGAFPLASLAKSLAGPHPHAIILNSCATTGLLRAFQYSGHPPITLMIHERLFPLPPGRREEIADSGIRIIFPSESVRRFWIENDARFEAGVTLYHGMIDHDFGLGDRARARSLVRGDLGLPAEAPLVLGCGTRHQGKGFDLFLQIAAQASSASGRAIHFAWLGGSRDDFSPIQQLWIEHDIRELGIASRLHLIESQVETEPYYLAADLFLMPSRDDSFPFVVLDAMAARLPVIAFDRAGGAPEALEGGCGKIVPYLSVSAMAESTVELLSDPLLRERIGKAAETRVRSTYIFEKYAADIMAIAEAGAASGAAPVPVSDSN